METTGRQLRIERLQADVPIKALAARIGFSRQTVWTIERSPTVDPERAARYRRALLDVILASRAVA